MKTHDQFISRADSSINEIIEFDAFVSSLKSTGHYAFEAAHYPLSSTETLINRDDGIQVKTLNFGCYNYLGYGTDPRVKQAAQQAIETYGLGAFSSPALNGTLNLHKELEETLINFFDLPTHGASLFSSGFGVCQGAIQAFMSPGTFVILDEKAHASMVEGARLSGASILYFKHNDMVDLEAVVSELASFNKRILICVEGVYGSEGDFCPLDQVVQIAKRYDAYTLVDEAHSVLIAGEHGRGASEVYGVLDQVDLYAMTFSKSFGGGGGALLAKKSIAHYINLYATCRAFSCALDPGLTGGLIQVLKLAGTEDGAIRRNTIRFNARYLSQRLSAHVRVPNHHNWIIPVIFGSESKALDIYNTLHQAGLDASIHIYPAVPKNSGRIRLFVSAAHTQDQLDRCADIIATTAQIHQFEK